MKNFTAKTADFDNLTISGQAPITPQDIGTSPDKIPLNKDLGSLAYQDAANLDDLRADNLELREIAAEISDSAVDVFVYDTSRDSDGGAWRKRTQHTSWYNEELNTPTRGARREFPAVAVIVAEANKVTIYDGDNPDLSMWMVFENLGTFSFVRNNLNSVFASNGQLCIGNNGGLSIARFANDSGYSYFTSERRTWSSVIATRTELIFDGARDTSIVIVNNNINDVAMTVLPNAPIDEDTGLPVPTIAVATDGGASVIRDDGTVVDSASGSKWYRIDFHNSVLYGTLDGNPSPLYIVEDYSSDQFTQSARIYPNTAFGASDSGVALLANAVTDESEVKVLNDIALSNAAGLTLVDDKEVKTTLHAYITSKYNTGWMPGDIKLAALSDSVVENVGVNSDELVENGDFSTNVTAANFATTYPNWTSALNATLSVENNRIKVDGSANYATALQSITGLVSGKMYTISLELISGTSTNPYFTTNNTGGANQIQGNFELGFQSHTFISNGETLEIRLVNSSTGSGYAYFDNISVRATTELITNGDFSTALGDEWSDESTGTGSISLNASGYIDLISQGSGNRAIADQSFSIVIGKTYTLSLDVIATDENSSVYLGTSAGANDITSGALNFLSLGVHSFTFVATTTTTFIRLWGSTESSTNSFDNISVRPAVEDRSVNGNGLQIVGEINKTPVASGADLVAYSGFSADNYLVQPYNEDLDFGTGDFCVMGWAKTSSTENQKIFTRDLDLQNRFQVYLNNGGVSVFTEVNDEFSYFEGSTDVDNGSWFCFCCVRRSGILEVYANGNRESGQESSNHTVLRDINFGEINSFVGKHIHSTSNSFDGSIALLRISATAPTPEQIAKIYRDEKPLFTDGAQATLYGTSDATTALSYDEKTELLHVGTSAGRSDFSGLRRINNATTAITTSISAHNNLIAEQ